MSLYAALFSGVSGLNAYGSALGIISDNITNVNTVGYKAAQAEFSTIVTESSSTTTYSSGGVRARPRSIIGQQGLPTPSQSGTDLAIEGPGFFVVNTEPSSSGQGGEVSFTRAGSFRPDPDGFLRNTGGFYILGWELESDGSFNNNGDIGSLVPINTSGLTGTAEPTRNVNIRANLQSSQEVNQGLINVYNPNDPNNNFASGNIPPDFDQNIEVFDSQGSIHTLTMGFLKLADNEWAVEVYSNPTDDIITGPGLAPGQLVSGTIRFNPTDGSLNLANTSPQLTAPITAQFNNGTGATDITLGIGSDGELDGITQFDSLSTFISTSRDGAVFGNVVGVDIDDGGVVTALFDNGLTRPVFQVPLATFQNPDGLRRQESNTYGVSREAGNLSLVEAGNGGSGSVVSFALEASTVDLASEFTSLITAQRAFSASTRIITTVDEMLTELNNI